MSGQELVHHNHWLWKWKWKGKLVNLKNIVVEESVMRASHFGDAVAAWLWGAVFVLFEAFPSVCWHCYCYWSLRIERSFIQKKWLVVSSRRKRKMEFFLENTSCSACLHSRWIQHVFFYFLFVKYYSTLQSTPSIFLIIYIIKQYKKIVILKIFI